MRVFKRCLLIVFAASMLPMSAQGTITGPMATPPGGVGFDEIGNIGRQNGLLYMYSGHDPIDIASGLYYGHSPLYEVQMSMDGLTFTGEETMTFAGIAGNIARWQGSSFVRVLIGGSFQNVPVPTQFRLIATDSLGTPIDFVDPVTVGLPAEALAVFPVTGDFRVSLHFEAMYNPGVWEPALDLFDALPNDPNTLVNMSVDTGYYARICLCELDGVTGIDVFDLLAYLALWFPEDPQADIDDIAGVTVFDLLAYLECWFPASMTGECP